MTGGQEIRDLRFRAVEDLIDVGWSGRKALETLGVARSSWYYRANPRPRVKDPIHQADRDYSRSLTDREVGRMEQLILAAWVLGLSVSHAFANAWDKGEYLASVRSWYRVARSMEDQHLRPPTPRRAGKKRQAPVVQATGPGQVWVWDITDLKGPFMGMKYKAYSVQDLYSRKIIAYEVHPREEDHIAIQMFEKAFGEEGIPGTLHADNGAVMRSGALSGLCDDLGIHMSHNRPSVSNDNSFKESEFRTMKTRPNYPKYFETIEDARIWLDEYVHWFNTQHHHSALAWHTPQTVADGTWKTTHKARAQTLNDHYKTHPHRYHKKPRTNRPPKTVGINLHKTKTQKQTTH